MAKILSFKPRLAYSGQTSLNDEKSLTAQTVRGGAEILFFTGVRYERAPEAVSSPIKSRSKKPTGGKPRRRA